MRKLVPAVLAVMILCVVASADPNRPTLPVVPQGFDEGRSELNEEVGEGLIPPGALVERLFESADAFELAGFISAHLLSDEKQSLDDHLKLDGDLVKCSDAAGLQQLFADRKLKPVAVAKAIAGMLVARKYTLADVAAWLYMRGYNYRILQRALNGERLDAFRMRAKLRALEAPTAAAALTTGLWEFNLNDGREEKGGHYDGVQLAQFLLKTNWQTDDFRRLLKAAGERDLTEAEQTLIEWGDPELVWSVLEPWAPESSLMQAIRKHYADKDDPRVLAVCAERANATVRWFRTGGNGVRGVYRGPWPNAKGDPRPPTTNVVEIGEVDASQFANALDADIRAHFEKMGETITLVVYDDGSARAILDKPSREPIKYRADHPFGASTGTRQPYEGRLSIEGRNALLYLVYGENRQAAPEQFELANVKLAAGDCFLLADIDDGLNLTPILLRRINPLD